MNTAADMMTTPAAETARLLARGKLPKVALVACMHKLLFAVYSVAKHRRPFVPRPITEGAQL
jgi:hypothetical protein